jgi:outer membrane receptor for ferrienterochelin and colicin
VQVSAAKRLLYGSVALWAASVAFAQPQPAVSQGGADPFALDLDSLLNTKVSTASKFTEKLSDAAGVVSVVTQDELRRFGGTTLLQVLERVAGLNVTSEYLGDNSLVTVRGDQTADNGDHILILINGRPVREVLEGGIIGDILESFPIGILERIEVVKGPGSVLYGSNAFSGVINLITQKADGNSFQARAAEGAAGERSVSEEIFYRKGAFDLIEGGQYHNWPGWNVTVQGAAPGTPATTTNTAIRNEGTGGYLGLDYKDFSFMSSYTGQEAPAFIYGNVGDTRAKRGFADFAYRLHPAARWEMTVNTTYSRFVMDAPVYPGFHSDSHEADLEWTNFITFSAKDRLTLGTVYNHIAGSDLFTSAVPNFLDAHGKRNAGEGYVQWEHKLTDEIRLIGGVQLNKIGAIALQAVPRGGIVWNPSSHITMKVLYGEAYKAPSIAFTTLNDPDVKGNPNLISEKVGTIDAQLSYQSNRVQASADYFHSRLDDLIYTTTSGFPGTLYNSPIPVNVQGGEAEGKYYVQRDWFVTGSMLYQHNDSGQGVSNLSPSPNVVAKAGVSYLSPKGLTFSAFDAYQGHVAGYGSALNPPANAFHAVSAHVRYDISKHWMKNDTRGVALFLNADDLLNHPIWLAVRGPGENGTIPVTRGRTVFFGLEVWQKQARQ